MCDELYGDGFAEGFAVSQQSDKRVGKKREAGTSHKGTNVLCTRFSRLEPDY